MAIDWEAYRKKAKKLDGNQNNISNNDIAPIRTTTSSTIDWDAYKKKAKALDSYESPKKDDDIGPVKKSLFDDGYDFGDITKTILGSREQKEQKTSNFDDALTQKYSAMSLADIEKEYARVEAEEKAFKDENGGKLLNYLTKAGSYIAEGKSGTSGSATRSKSQANIDKINDLTREKEIINVYRKQRATEEYLGGLNDEQLQLLDSISESDALEDIAPINSALANMTGGDTTAYNNVTASAKKRGETARGKLYNQLKEKNPKKSDEELNEIIDNMVELRRNQVNAEEQAKRDTELKETATEHSVGSAILSRGANILGGVTGLTEIYLQRDNEYGLDTNAAGFMLTNSSNTIDEQVQLDHDWTIEVGGAEIDAFDFMYNAGTGIIDNLGRLALSGGNASVSSVMMFAQSTTQSIIDGKEKGYSDAKALTMGLLNGTFEALLEKLSLDIILGEGGNALRKIAKSFVAEGGEELTSNWLNRIADEVANGNHSELSKMYDSYINEGYTESQALAEVICSVIGEDFETFLIGGLSGGIMGGSVEVARTISNKTSTKSEKNTVNKLVEEKVAEATKKQAIEKAVNKAIEERETEQGGKLSDENKKALRETTIAKIESGEIDISSEKFSKKDIAKIEKEVKGFLNNGNIEVSKIEEILTPDETKQINELKETLDNTKDEQKKAEIEGKIKQLETARLENLKSQARDNKYLRTAIAEYNASRTTYQDDSEVTDEYEKAVVETAKKYVDNTTKTRKFVNAVRKLAKDRQTRYIFTNNQALLEQGDLKVRDDISADDQAKIKSLEKQLSEATTEEAKAKIQAEIIALKYYDTGGLVRKNENGVETVIINVDSIQSKYSVVGYETKHTLEKYELNEKFNELLFEYAKNKGDLDAERSRIESIYKNQEDADIDGEVAAELTGKYLFEDENFLDTLLKNKSDSKVQQIIEKIKELIDDLVTRFKGTEQEKQLREVQNKFTELYNSTDADIVNEIIEGTQYSIDNNQNLVYNDSRGERYVRTDEFRNLQAESQRMSYEDTQAYWSGSRKIDEEVRGRLSRAFGLELRPTNSKRVFSVRTLLNPKTNNTLNIVEGVDASLFHDIFEISRKYLKYGELVDLHDIETTEDHGIGYKYCDNYLSEDGLSGFSITPDGDLISVFNLSSERGFLKTIRPIVKEKVKTLDCYISSHQDLQMMYNLILGFKTASVMDYNMKYDHDNIAKNHEEPKVAFMVNIENDVEVKNFTKDEYDEAVTYRNSFINQAGSNGSASSIAEKKQYSLSDSHKEKQLDIINKYHPKADWDYQTWITSVDDIKTFAETVEDESNYATTPDFTDDDVAEALKTGKVKVYSSHDIRNGTFVTPSYMEAKNYAGQGKVNSMVVNLEDVAWIDSLQGQYAPVKSEKYSLARQDENVDYSKSLRSIKYQPMDDLPIREDVAKNTTTTFDDIAPISEEEANAMREEQNNIAPFTDADVPPEFDAPMYDATDTMSLNEKTLKNISAMAKDILSLNTREKKLMEDIVQKYSTSEISSKEELFDDIKKLSGEKSWTERNDEIAEIKKVLRDFRINVSPFIKRDITDYSQFMRSNFGKLRFSKDGLSVDDVYIALSTAYPHFFPADVVNPTDQLLLMSEVANTEINTTNTYELDDDVIQEATDVIAEEVNTYKEQQLLKLTEKEHKAFFKNVVASDKPIKTTRADLHNNIVDNIKTKFAEKGFDLDEVLKKAKDLSTFATVDNTPQRVMEKALGYKEGQILADETVNKVAQNETEGIKWLNSFTNKKNGLLVQISKQYNIKPGSKESAAAQMYAEGFYVNANNDIIKYGDEELKADFPNAKVRGNIKGLANDPRIRLIYDETLAKINESRSRNAYPEIPRLENYFLHFRAMEDTFSRLGLPFNPNDIRAKDLPTDLNGVTADLKPGQPYFASAMHRTGKRTSFDLLGGLERYLSSAKNQIYHIDDIQTLRALRNFVADTYGQATGLENLDKLSEEEVQERIKQVYGSHLSTFAKFLNEEANILAGKTSLIDRGLEGVIGRRGITFLDTINKQVGSNMVGLNISSSLTNILPVVQTFAKSSKFAFTKAFAQTVSNRIRSIYGKSDGFKENSPVVIRRKGAESFYRTPFQKIGDTGYILMSAVDDISTELIARTKYNELTQKGMDSQQAHIETDKWVSRLMGDRSLGQQPQLYNSKMLGLITKFQLEVRNQLDSQFYDTIQEAKVSNEQIENALLRNAKTAAKVGSTFFQLAVLQHLFGTAFESVAGYNPAFDIVEVLIKAFGFDDDEEDEDTALDNIEEAFLTLLEDLPYTSTLTGGRIPISSALPIKELVTGEDDYGTEKSRVETLKETLPYYLLPGGYGQLKKTVQGLKMFDDNLPIAGSYTDSGNLRFPVEDTPLNKVQAGLFGQYANKNARKYFDDDIAPLNEKQIKEYADLDLPIADYWKYREGLKGLETLNEKGDYIGDLDLPISKKNILINNIADRDKPIDYKDFDLYSDFEEFDFATRYPEKYAVLKEQGISVAEYKEKYEETAFMYTDDFAWASNNPEKYTLSKAVTNDVTKYKQYTTDLYNIKADKDSNGKSISGSRKKKVLDYINNLDIDYGAKCILLKSEYSSDDTYNKAIVDYLLNRDDITTEEKRTILEKLGATIDSNGYIHW